MLESKDELLKINGVELSVAQAGEKHDESMIMVHGLGFSKESMLPLFEHYRHHYHVVSYDTRGSGYSDKPESWTLDDDAEDLKALVEELGLKRPVGIGFSMGSFIVMRAAEIYPNLFSKIVLIGTSGKDPASYDAKPDEAEMQPREAQKQGSQTQAVQSQESQGVELRSRGTESQEPQPTNAQIVKKIKGTTEAPQGFFAEILDAIKMTEKMIEGHEEHPLQAAELIERTRPTTKLTEDQFKSLHQSFVGFDNMTDASKVTVPVLCLTGSHDHANPPYRGRAVAEAVKNGQFYEIPGAGHVAMYENLPDVLKHINAFLKDDDE